MKERKSGLRNESSKTKRIGLFKILTAALFVLCLFILESIFPGSLILTAACDGRNSSPSGAVGFIQPQPGIQEGAPAEIEAAIPPVPDIPLLDPPLLADDSRMRELQPRLYSSFLLKNKWKDFSQFIRILEKQVLIDKRIEAALVHDGYTRHSLFEKRHEIRGILFYSKGISLKEPTLNHYLSQIERDGTRQSLPYRKVVRAICKYHIVL